MKIKKYLFTIYCLFIITNNLQPVIPTTALGEILTVSPYSIAHILFTYGINTDYITTSTTGTGSVTSPGALENLATISSGTTALSNATLQSRTRLSYQPGQGASTIFTALFPEAGIADTLRIIGVGNSQDGLFFGFNGTDFAILHRSSGSGVLVDTWIPQASWNQDKFDGTGTSGVTLDPTKGNVFKIQFQYLGFGSMKFFIENSNTGEFTLVHNIEYANNNTIASLLNPSLQIMVYASTTSGDQVSIKTGSLAGFFEGNFFTAYDTRNGLSSRKLIDVAWVGTNLNMLVIKNNTTFQGKINQVTVYPDFIYLFNGSARSATATFSLYLNPTFGVAPTFPNSVNANTSVISYDTSNIFLTGGKLILAFKLNNNTNYTLNLFDYGIQLVPGDSLACICNPSAKGTPMAVAMSWKEKF